MMMTRKCFFKISATQYSQTLSFIFFKGGVQEFDFFFFQKFFDGSDMNYE